MDDTTLVYVLLGGAAAVLSASILYLLWQCRS